MTHLTLKVFADELEGIVQCMDSSQLNVRRGLVLAGSVNHSG